MRLILLFALCGLFQAGYSQKGRPLPIIDMHLHAYPANAMGSTPSGICSPFKDWNYLDPKEGGESYYINTVTGNLYCNGKGFKSPTNDDSLMNQTLRILDQYNIYAFTSGSFSRVQKWKKAAPERIITGIEFSPTMPITPDRLKKWLVSDSVKVFGEIVAQYDGISLSDTIMEPYLKVAEELDIPVSVHVGPGPPGIAYAGAANYRAKYHSALVIEEALIRHPKLRVIVAHAGWPMIDDMLAVLYVHPQVYVDLGILCYAFPKKEFYNYLQRLIDAGFEKRICFGSDQMVWPQAIVAGIETINSAAFLNAGQKRDILYNNAARFLRLTEADLKKQAN